MLKKFAKYMRYGKKVEYGPAGIIYNLVQDMPTDGNARSVLAVREDKWERYSLLKTWSGNHVGLTEDEQKEMSGYVESLEIEAVTPGNTIRFITSDYQTKFRVMDLTQIRVNGEVARVAYLDEHHFTFVDAFAVNLWGGCFHICQFAELCEAEGIEVEPV